MKINDKLTKDIRDNISNITGKILWTNNDTTKEFTSQTITLSNSDYDCYSIIYRTLTTQNCYLNSGIIPKEKGINLLNLEGASGTGIRSRRIDFTDDTHLLVNNAYISSGTNGSINNAILIPLYIIGYKTGLF